MVCLFSFFSGLLSAKTIHVSIYIDDPNSDGGSTVTPDVTDTGLEDTVEIILLRVKR